MISIAQLILDREAAGLDYRAEFDAIPAFQLEIRFADLSRLCPSHRPMGTPRRPANALNVEIGSPLPRCVERSPDGRGLAWLLSGGSLLAYGTCDLAACPRATSQRLP